MSAGTLAAPAADAAAAEAQPEAIANTKMRSDSFSAQSQKSDDSQTAAE